MHLSRDDHTILIQFSVMQWPRLNQNMFSISRLLGSQKYILLIINKPLIIIFSCLLAHQMPACEHVCFTTPHSEENETRLDLRDIW